MASQLKELSDREESRASFEGTSSPQPGAAAWAVQGMELEVAQ